MNERHATSSPTAGAGAVPVPGAAATPWFAPAWTMLPLAARRSLVRNAANGVTAELSSPEWAVLSSCEGCHTLSEHEQQVAERLRARPEHRSAIRARLELFCQRVMLLRLDELVARFGAPRNVAPIALEDVVIRTADRPDLLASAIDLETRTGRRQRWHVVDDSRAAAAATGGLADFDLVAADGARFAPEARIRFTQNHPIGDPGASAFPFQLLSLPPRSRRWLSANPTAASHAFASRINWRGQPRLRLAVDRVLTSTTIAGVNNGSLLPPTARNYCSTDVLLGAVAGLVYRSGWLVDLPLALPHSRDAVKRWLKPTDSFRQEPLPFLIDHLEARGASIVAEAPEERLPALGALACGLAAARDARLAELLGQQAAETAARTIFALREQLDRERFQ